MDVAEPPRIVFENPRRCADGHHAEQLLKQVLSRARAPGHAWLVTMRVGSGTPGTLEADGEITDDDGTTVGHRVVTGKPGDCGGLARAIGVWASLVLDAEINRPRPAVAAEGETPATPPSDDKSQSDPAPSRDTKGQPSPAEAQSAAVWPPPPPGEKPTRREDARTIEIGAGGFLMTGVTGAGGDLLVGGTPFVVVEVAKGVFLRPAIELGASVPSAAPRMTLGATRLDVCMRLAGLYTNLHGMQLDICGGADVGILDADRRVLPYVDFGPSLDLRGELGGDLAVVLRGLVNINAVHDDVLGTPLWGGRGELAISWRLR